MENTNFCIENPTAEQCNKYLGGTLITNNSTGEQSWKALSKQREVQSLNRNYPEFAIPQKYLLRVNMKTGVLSIVENA